jgi:hypothetical protein
MTILFGGKPTEAEFFSIGSLGVTSAKSINGNSYFFGHNRSFLPKGTIAKGNGRRYAPRIVTSAVSRSPVVLPVIRRLNAGQILL